VLAKHVAQVFYVTNTTNKRLKVVIPRKRWIIRVKNVIDDEEFDQFDEIPPFVTWMVKPRIPSAKEAPYLRNDDHEKVKNFKKPRLQWKVAKWLCKICSLCENMVICVKNWFYLIFVWNILNVWKYGHLCENLTFIGHWCEICSMCKNIVIWCPGSASEVCVVSEALCSVSDEHYTESSKCSVSDEEKREACVNWACITS
jgi:hypothetical protein